MVSFQTIYLFRYNTHTHERDGRTDGRTPHDGRDRAVRSVARLSVVIRNNSWGFDDVILHFK